MTIDFSTLPRLDGKRVLITGGLGFIGSNLGRTCVELGAKVTIYDCLDPNSGGNVYSVSDIRSKIELRLHDILNFDTVLAYSMSKFHFVALRTFNYAR